MNAPDPPAATGSMPRLAPALPAAGRRGTLAPLAGSADALALAQVALDCVRDGRVLAVLAADALAAQRLAGEIRWFAPGVECAAFPDWETLPYDPISPHEDLVSARLSTLYRLTCGEVRVVIAPVSTAMHRLAPASFLAGRAFFLRKG